MTLKNILMVAAGGMLGSVCRFLAGSWLYKPGALFPWPTFSVNILGSLIIGLAMGYSARHEPPPGWTLLLTTGFCGGFTTFSALSAETVHLLRQQQYGILIVYILATLILGISAAAAGFALSKLL